MKTTLRSEVSWVWGLGGVGKTHTSLREAYLRAKEGKRVLLFTLDPSQRLFDLVGVTDKKARESDVTIAGCEFFLRRSDPIRLLEILQARIPAHPTVQNLYMQMSRGFEDFRHYLNLLELAEEIEKGEFQTIIIDTPPFQEARGLEHAIRYLHDFFGRDLVQLALRSSQFSFLHSPVKKIFELTGIFVGKKTSSQVFSFVEWLVEHADRFRKAALLIRDLLDSPTTEHIVILTPESSLEVIQGLKDLLPPKADIRIVMNRSVYDLDLPQDLSKKSAFMNEISTLKTREEKVRKDLAETLSKKRKSPDEKIESIPFCFMGDDSREELEKFVKL